MTQAIPQTEPTEITAGDTVQWTRLAGDYPSPAWDVSYILINSTSKITIDATDSGSDHLVSVDAATSTGYAAGLYQWQCYATNGVQRATIDTGEILIKPNFFAVSTLDTRSITKRTLDAIEAVLEKRASTDQEMYAIAGRQLKRTPMPDLIMLRDKYKSMYMNEQRAEKIKNGQASGNKILVRF